MLQMNSARQDSRCCEQIYDESTPFWRSRLLELHMAGQQPDGMFARCFRAMTTSLLDRTRWLHLPQSEKMSTTIIRVSLRPAAVLYDWLARPLQQWPYKLFQCTANAALLDTLIEEATLHPCKLDEFTMALLQQIEQGAVKKEDLPDILAVTGLQMLGNTFAVEQMHSCNARRARRRVQARAMQVSDLAMWLQSHNGFPWLHLETDSKADFSCLTLGPGKISRQAYYISIPPFKSMFQALCPHKSCYHREWTTRSVFPQKESPSHIMDLGPLFWSRRQAS